MKKRNKKLLLFAPSRRLKWANQVLPFIGKSFLVLFFKTELLIVSLTQKMFHSSSRRSDMLIYGIKQLKQPAARRLR